MSKKKEKNKFKKLITKKNVSIGLLIAVLLGGVYMYLFIQGYPNYYHSYFACGMRNPVAIYYWSPYNKQYSLPGDQSYPNPSTYFVKYVCTEKEAINVGAKYAPTADDINSSY